MRPTVACPGTKVDCRDDFDSPHPHYEPVDPHSLSSTRRFSSLRPRLDQTGTYANRTQTRAADTASRCRQSVSGRADPLDESDRIPTPPAEFHLGDTQAAKTLMDVKGESFRYGREDYHREQTRIGTDEIFAGLIGRSIHPYCLSNASNIRL